MVIIYLPPPSIMLSNSTLPLKEICTEISSDLKSRRITQKLAAEMLGTTKQTIANQLSGKKRFSINMAKKFCDKLGYSIEFLLYGRGPLYAPGKYLWHSRPGTFPELLGRENDPVMRESYNCHNAAHILEIINDKVAIECFEKGVAGDYEECNRLMKILTSRYCYDIPAMTKDPRITKAFREMREWFRKAEVESAKRLIIIEQKAALGEIIDIDAELERFKERLLIIKRNNSEAALKAHPEISPNDYMTEEELETLSRFFKNDEPGISF
jgi:DNA-binding XRE family transcriptional regulator